MAPLVAVPLVELVPLVVWPLWSPPRPQSDWAACDTAWPPSCCWAMEDTYWPWFSPAGQLLDVLDPVPVPVVPPALVPVPVVPVPVVPLPVVPVPVVPVPVVPVPVVPVPVLPVLVVPVPVVPVPEVPDPVVEPVPESVELPVVPLVVEPVPDAVVPPVLVSLGTLTPSDEAALEMAFWIGAGSVPVAAAATPPADRTLAPAAAATFSWRILESIGFFLSGTVGAEPAATAASRALNVSSTVAPSPKVRTASRVADRRRT